MSGDCASIRERYLESVAAALARPVGDDVDVALHAFLTLNAGYFLGEWLDAEAHAAVVDQLAEALDRAGGLSVPSDAAHALQLAQHVRELAAEFGPLPGLAPLIEQTATLVPDHPADWDAALRAAASREPDEPRVHDLLVAHARRRLWELQHPVAATIAPAALQEQLRHAAGRAAKRAPHTIQVTEAVLAELTAHPGHDSAYRDAHLRFALAADLTRTTGAASARQQPPAR